MDNARLIAAVGIVGTVIGKLVGWALFATVFSFVFKAVCLS